MEMRIDPRKVAPEVYRAMFALESAVKATNLSNLLDLVNSGSRKSMGVHIALTCTARTCEPRARTKSDFTCWTHGVRHLSIPTVNGLRWRGQRR